ncbi:MAG TPA: ABC transporter permease [Balneolaceae bacterium]|nr:ABC transporter permease [Balneolaceae bacterium]
MNFRWHLALRYFKGGRQGSHFLSFIKIMAIGGITIGSAGLLIALSIVHGFKSTIDNKVLGFAPHIKVATFSAKPIFRTDTLMATLKKFPQIARAEPVVTGQAMIQSPENVTGTLVKGISPSGKITDLRHYIYKGRYSFSADSAGGLPGIVIGQALATQLQTKIGDKITVYTVNGIPSPLESPNIQQFRLTGIYKTGIHRFDEAFALINRKYAKKLFSMPGVYSSAVDIKLKNNKKIKSFDSKLSAALPYPYYTETIYEKFYGIFQWVNLQEQTIPFVISGMIIVAAFNLIGTILMMVLERTRDIGILKTMGARDRDIRSVFLFEGLLVGFTGLIFGVALSLLFDWLQGQYHIIPLSEQNYYMSYAPVEPHGLDFAIVIVTTIILCALASWLPARIASKTDPLKVIAYGR